MIQFNLLPDIKLKYIKTQRTKRIVMLASIITTGVSLLLLATLYVSVQIVQKKRIDSISKDIVAQVKSLNDTKDLNKILTIQNQLNSLPDLHNKKPVASRLFGSNIQQATPAQASNGEKPVTSRLFGYIEQVTPAQANIAKMDIDFDANTISIVGTADNLVTVNMFADTLKFATYKSTKTDKGKPFSDVVTVLAINDKGASFTLTFKFDPVLFGSDDTPTLIVPKIISTRSETEKPASVFKEQPLPVNNTNGAQ